mmetsp:Transcript_27027/g.85556  ORF Transcript_27027/g.85556 Transcript_27027/m.85556 type:complete len:260 (+) Transcript_27027:219-998(+)
MWVRQMGQSETSRSSPQYAHTAKCLQGKQTTFARLSMQMTHVACLDSAPCVFWAASSRVLSSMFSVFSTSFSINTALSCWCKLIISSSPVPMHCVSLRACSYSILYCCFLCSSPRTRASRSWTCPSKRRFSLHKCSMFLFRYATSSPAPGCTDGAPDAGRCLASASCGPPTIWGVREGPFLDIEWCVAKDLGLTLPALLLTAPPLGPVAELAPCIEVRPSPAKKVGELRVWRPPLLLGTRGCMLASLWRCFGEAVLSDL